MSRTSSITKSAQNSIKSNDANNQVTRFPNRSGGGGSSSSTVINVGGVTSRVYYFTRPTIVVYRFLDVIKSKHNLAVECWLYVEDNLFQFLREYWTRDELQELIDQIRIESYNDSQQNPDAPVVFRPSQSSFAVVDSVVMYVKWRCIRAHNALDLGHDCTPIQTLIHWVLLEGMITGRFNVSISERYVDTFKHFRDASVPQLIFSPVPRLLYNGKRSMLSFTDQGDLVGYFHFLDCQMNTKSKQTYVTVASLFHQAPRNFLFVSASYTECKKAARAGYMVAQIRSSNGRRVPYRSVRLVEDISQIRIQTATPSTSNNMVGSRTTTTSSTTNNIIPSAASIKTTAATTTSSSSSSSNSSSSSSTIMMGPKSKEFKPSGGEVINSSITNVPSNNTNNTKTNTTKETRSNSNKQQLQKHSTNSPGSQ